MPTTPTFRVIDQGERTLRKRRSEQYTVHRYLVWSDWDQQAVHSHQTQEAAERCALLFQETRLRAERTRRGETPWWAKP